MRAAGADSPPLQGGSGVHTSGSQTGTGAQGQVSSGASGSQSVIPASGRNPHRGKGAPAITCRFQTINLADPLGGAGADAGSPYDLPVGTQTWRTCYSTATGQRVEGPTLYTTTPGAAGGGAPDITAQLVDIALANVDIDLPEPRLSPPNETFPNFDTWLWTSDVPTQTASASAGGVTITVTAKVESTRFEINPSERVDAASPDDHRVITCRGTSTAYDPNRPERDQDTDCSHRFAAPTRDLTIETTVTWRLSWTATNGRSDDLGTIGRTITTPYRVQEKTTVIRTDP